MRKPDTLSSRPRRDGKNCPKCRARLTTKSVPVDGVPWGTYEMTCCAECGWFPAAPPSGTGRKG